MSNEFRFRYSHVSFSGDDDRLDDFRFKDTPLQWAGIMRWIDDVDDVFSEIGRGWKNMFLGSIGSDLWFHRGRDTVGYLVNS